MKKIIIPVLIFVLLVPFSSAVEVTPDERSVVLGEDDFTTVSFDFELNKTANETHVGIITDDQNIFSKRNYFEGDGTVSLLVLSNNETRTSKIRFMSEHSVNKTISVEINRTGNNNTEENENKTIIVERMQGTGNVIKRNSQFWVETKTEDGKSVSDVKVVVMEMDSGEIIGQCTSDSYGMCSIPVDQDVEGPDVIIEARTKKENYVGSKEVYSFAMSWDQYKREYTLSVGEMKKEYTEEKEITNEVKNKAGESVGSVTVEVNKPSGSESINTDVNGEFSFEVDSEGDWVLNPTLSGYFSEEKSISVLADSDGDGVPDEEDDCPNTSANTSSGCNPKDVNINVLKDGKDYNEDLVVGQKYAIELTNSDGERLNVSDNIENENIKIGIQDGYGEFKVDKEGSYTITGFSDNPRYKEYDETLRAEVSSIEIIIGYWWVLPLLLIGGGVLILIIKKRRENMSPKVSKKKTKMKSSRQTGPSIAQDTEEVDV